jgi:hypothetical protein
MLLFGAGPVLAEDLGEKEQSNLLTSDSFELPSLEDELAEIEAEAVAELENNSSIEELLSGLSDEVIVSVPYMGYSNCSVGNDSESTDSIRRIRYLLKKVEKYQERIARYQPRLDRANRSVEFYLSKVNLSEEQRRWLVEYQRRARVFQKRIEELQERIDTCLGEVALLLGLIFLCSPIPGTSAGGSL